MNSPRSILTVQDNRLSRIDQSNIPTELADQSFKSFVSDHRLIEGTTQNAGAGGGTQAAYQDSPRYTTQSSSESLCRTDTTAPEKVFASGRYTASPDTIGTTSTKDFGSPSKKRTFPSEPTPTIPDYDRPPSKKIWHPHISQNDLDSLDYQNGPHTAGGDRSPPSPLFFSHTPKERPLFLPRFSSPEAGETMMRNAEDHEGLRNVKLARGTSKGSADSPLRTMSTPTGRQIDPKSSASQEMAPEASSQVDGVQVLGQVGIIELLKQDERPTFIIDLGDPANFHPGALHVLFSNASLNAHPGLLDMICGKAGDSSYGLASPSTFPDFKAWAVSFVKDHEPLSVVLPSFPYGRMIWTCSTIRKRFRVFSGNFDSGHRGLVGYPSSFKPHAQRSKRTLVATSPSSRESAAEPTDYFGAFPVNTSGASSDAGKSSTLKTPDPRPYSPPEDRVRSLSDHNASSKTSPVPLRQKSSPSSSQQNEVAHLAAIDDGVDPFSDSAAAPDQGFFDWTRLPVSEALPRHLQIARSVDWASTSLGPIEEWSPNLRCMCNLIMASPHPAAMYWGPDLIAIYNEAYTLIAGQKHPMLMGMSYREAWSEIWDEVKDAFANAHATAEATMKDDDRLFMRRLGFLEETYFSWSLIPLIGDDGSVVGLYNPAFEKTRRKIAERRMLTLREVGERTATAREVKSFWGEVLKGLAYNELDTPFAVLYSVFEDTESDESSVHSNILLSTKQCILEGALGVPNGHQAAPQQIDLKSGTEGFGPAFREALKADKPIVLEVEDGTLPSELLDGIQWRGFGDRCRCAVVCPIHPTTGDTNQGFLIMGINPRRPYDEDYNLFIQLLSRQLATSVASVVLFEEEIRRGQRAARLAAQDHIELSNQLAARTQEAVESENKFTRMAEFAPVGMFIADSTGRITYCNDAWYDISRHPRQEDGADDWMDSIKDEDRDLVEKFWRALVDHKVPISAEFRFKAPWQDRNGNLGDTWVLASAYPEKSREGQLKSVFGSFTNISQQKWAEDVQKRRMEEAVELKRQQENFIDITSHEMRNPLSAILQCSDDITASLTDLRKSQEVGDLPAEILDSNIDAAQTITLFAQHQKRIVDDVLTLSKLDSALLLVTPVDVQPATVVQRALKMFEGELQTADIHLDFHVEDSFQTLRIDWVRLDPSRLLQVLINLTTNAIKFTTTQEKRTITVGLGASLQRPSDNDKRCVTYVPSRSKRKDPTTGPDWGSGEQIFIHFAVQDTGRGLTDSEKRLLFLRFSQASPRTHVTYGGSGLGLFISRELVELQGGEIGVSSESEKGSTFAFYVKARRSSAPKDGVDQSGYVPSRKTSGVKLQIQASMGAAEASMSSPKSARGDNTLKILVVEDNLVNQKVLAKQLHKMGCEVHVANHGGEAIERLKESRHWRGNGDKGLDISVILMDLEMPVMDGVTCARTIRELEEAGEISRRVPIIAVTANARVEHIEVALGTGVDDVVSKPFRIPELLPKMKDLAEKYRSASSATEPASSL